MALTGNNFKSIVLDNKFVNNFNDVFKKVIDIDVKSTDQKWKMLAICLP